MLCGVRKSVIILVQSEMWFLYCLMDYNMGKAMLFISLLTEVVMWNEIGVCFALMGDNVSIKSCDTEFVP